jgi:hypothetical protein
MDQAFLLHYEYLVAEHRIFGHQIKGPVRCRNGAWAAPAELGKWLAKKALEEMAIVVKADTLLAFRKLMAQTCDRSKPREAFGCPKGEQELEAVVIRIAKARRAWGDDRMSGPLQH